MTGYLKNALKLTCIVWILKLIGDHNTNADIFTSLIPMKRLPVLEAQMLYHFQEYIDLLLYDTHAQIANVTEYEVHQLKIFSFQTTRKNKVMQGDERLLENPIDSFHLLRRMVRQWDSVIRFMRCHKCPENHPSRVFTDVAAMIQKKTSWPKEEDFAGAAVALTRLVTTYRLNIDDLANGKIYDVQSSSLLAEDFSLIGDIAMERGMFHRAAIMYKTSNIIIKRTENYVPTDIMYNLTSDEVYGLSKRGSYLKLLTALLEDRDMMQYDEVLAEVGDIYPEIYFQFKMRRYTKNIHLDFVKQSCGWMDMLYQNYSLLCNDDIKTVDENSKLYCAYWPTSSLLVKAKAEYMNLNPPVVVFHDVLGELEIESMKEVTHNRFMRSAVQGTTVQTQTNNRISQTSWLGDSDDVALKLSKRIESLTRLDVLYKPRQLNSEEFQLVNYGLGGMYEPHIDAYDVATNDSFGTRMATWIYYLSDVTYGGATVFPLIRTRVPPKKGIAVFWLNLKRNGIVDSDTTHAGCPVLVGDKWIASKWIHERGQFRTRPCALDETQ